MIFLIYFTDNSVFKLEVLEKIFNWMNFKLRHLSSFFVQLKFLHFSICKLNPCLFWCIFIAFKSELLALM
uniref:Ovule protein n=1 Tax=Panagrolaimus sp. JU765 TaxID=591449 RepID=A0AC34R859_9BILA